jgi:hypothetical protein
MLDIWDQQALEPELQGKLDRASYRCLINRLTDHAEVAGEFTSCSPLRRSPAKRKWGVVIEIEELRPGIAAPIPLRKENGKSLSCGPLIAPPVEGFRHSAWLSRIVSS